jgi:DNA-dependent RNA polymerase auxiliary subunit epsilon
MNIKNFTEFNLPRDAYATFDATTLKDLIISRLNENEVFRDQVYEGSNINAFIDVVAYMYHVLLFYLNTTSTESTFTTASLYENMNKIVSNIGYKPIGKQTSLAVMSLSGNASMPAGVYTLKRFSSINAGGQPFVVTRDVNFEKTTTGVVEKIFPDNNFVYQGNIGEYPAYTATGESFEVVTIADNSPINDSNTFISDNSFSVFVFDTGTQTWSEWEETASLFLENSTSRKYEKRLNENGNFEFKFGNDVNGKKLKVGDVVQIYYVVSNGENGVVGANLMGGNQFVLYNSPTFNSISNNIYDSTVTFLPVSQLPNLLANNPNSSSPISDAETVDDIRINAPKLFAAQNRLVTKDDYKNFVERDYNVIVKSVSVLDNNEYTSTYLKYFYSIGLNKPNDDARVLFNQVSFSNSTSFNNVYLFCVPKTATIINETLPNYLNFSQKQLIVNQANNKKDITHNIVCADPVYKAVDIGLQLAGEKDTVTLKDNTSLVIKKSANTRISNDRIIDRVINTIKDYFNNIQLGQIIDLGELSNNIKNVDGVKDIETRRTDVNFNVPKLNLVFWNPVCGVNDVVFTSQNYTLEAFQYAFFYEISKLKNKIIVENE